MNLAKFLLLALITILVSVSLTSLFYTFFTIREVQELGMKVQVGEIVGFDVNTSLISFGIVPRNGFCERPVAVDNRRGRPLMVHIQKTGKMADWVHTSENNFILYPNETREIKFTISPPSDAEYGLYTGKARFILTGLI